MSLKEEVQEILETGYANAYELEAVAEYIENLESDNRTLFEENLNLKDECNSLEEDLQLSDEALQECTQRCNNE